MEIRTTDRGRDHLRELLVDEQVVSHLTVIDYQMRIGRAVVRMAGIGDVHTRSEYRKQGHMRALIEDSLHYMVGQGYDVSMLFGIRDFYTKFGYAVCLPEYRAVVRTRDAEEAGRDAPPCTVHEIAPQDIPAIVELYNRSNVQRTGSLVRDPAAFTCFPKGTRYGRPADGLLLRDERGRFAAYAAHDRSAEAVDVVEVESVDPAFFPALLFEFARMAIDRRCGHIALHVPPDHPFGEYVERFGCEWTLERPKNGGGVMRIVNQETLFAKIEPELARRAASRANQLCGSLMLRTDLAVTEIPLVGRSPGGGASERASTSVELSQGRLMQLVVGVRSARDVLNDPRVVADAAAGQVLDVLFPRGYPYTWLADRF